MNAFKKQNRNDLYSYIDYNNFTTNDENYPILTFIWNVDDPKIMIKICPELYQRVGINNFLAKSKQF
jgi:nucleoside-specific outer membrane channel protein Tsx